MPPRRVASRHWRRIAVLGLTVGFMAAGRGPAAAQSVGHGADRATTTPDASFAAPAIATVELITVAPGPALASRFGHAALRVRDPASGRDVAWSFGRSSVDDWNAVSMLLQGRLPDRPRHLDPDELVREYVEAGRTVHVQSLRLDAGQTAALVADLDAARGRRDAYWMIADNCSTRLRDAIDLGLGGRLRAATDTVVSTWTPRQHVAGYTASDPLFHLVVHTFLGPRVDRPATAWDEMFLPETLREGLRSVRVPTEGGGSLPLVIDEWTLHDGGAADTPPRRAESPLWLLVGAGLAGLLVAAHRCSPGAFALAGGGWALAVGVGGLALLSLGRVTSDPHLEGNASALVASPLLIVAAIAMWGGRPAPKAAATLFAVALGVGLLAVVLTLAGVPTGVSTSLAAVVLPSYAVLTAEARRATEASPD